MSPDPANQPWWSAGPAGARSGAPAPPVVSAIVVTWNSRETLGPCLNSIVGLRGLLVEVVVVDNGSTDGSPELALQYCSNAQLIVNDRNLGFAAACNQGIAASRGDYVLLVNSDVVLSSDFLFLLIPQLAATPQAGWASGKLLRGDGSAGAERIDAAGALLTRYLQARDRGAGELDRGQLDEAGWVFGVSAAVAIYKRAMLDDLRWQDQVFDSDFFAYYEDADLNWRAQWRNWRCWYDPRAVAYHRRGHATSHPLAIQRHAYANRLLMIAKNASPGVLRACLLPWLGFELYMLGRTALAHPEWLPAYRLAWRLWPAMRPKRAAIMAGRQVSDDELLRRLQPLDWGRRLRERWDHWRRSFSLNKS